MHLRSAFVPSLAAALLLAMLPGLAAAQYAPSRVWQTNLAGGRELALVGDFDGRNGDDVVVFVGDTQPEPARGDVLVALSTRTRFADPAKWHDFFCIGAEVPPVGDLNGDGRDDIATIVRDSQAEPAAGDVYVALSDGTRFLPSTLWQTDFCRRQMVPLAGDANRDGRDDLVAFTKSPLAVDDEGDVFVAGSRREGAFSPGVRVHDFFCVGAEIPLVCDLDGVRGCEPVTVVSGASGAWNAGYVYASYYDPVTRRLGPSRELTRAFSVANEVVEPMPGGLLAFNRSTGTVRAAGYTGGRLVVVDPVARDFCTGDQIPRAGDFDGNGTTDLACLNHGEVLVALSTAAAAPPPPPQRPPSPAAPGA